MRGVMAAVNVMLQDAGWPEFWIFFMLRPGTRFPLL